MNVSVFSNLLKDTQIHILADSDEQEVVQQVQVILVILLWVAPSSMMISFEYETDAERMFHGILWDQYKVYMF